MGGMFGNTELEKLRRTAPEKFQEFIRYLAFHNMTETAEAFAPVFGKSPKSLTQSIRSWNKQYHLIDKARIMVEQNNYTIVPAGGVPAAMPQETQQDRALSAQQPSGELTEAEEQFLQKFREGDLDFEAVQREFAYRVLKKVMADPRLLKASDWLKSEVIKIQREELNLKKEQMERSWAMLLGGFSYPQHCPNCGYDLMPKKEAVVEDGVLAEMGDTDAAGNESMGDSAGTA